MGSVVDNLTREDVIRLLIERRRMETLEQVIGGCIFMMMCGLLGWALMEVFTG